MISFVRTVSVMPGKAIRAMTFAKKSVAQVLATTGVTLRIMVPIGGNSSRIAWYAGFDTLADVDGCLVKLAADPVYLALLEEFADVFVPNSLSDKIWKAV